MKDGFRTVACVAAVVLIACGSDSTGPILPDRPDVLGLEDFTFRPDRGPEVHAQLGRLWLPDSGGSAQESLFFVVLPATTPEPGPPIVYLAGGPGGSGIATGRGDRFSYFQELQAFGDVILLDQRGVGGSTPNTRCLGELRLPLDRPVDRGEAASEWVAQVRDCADALRARGVDLDRYNTRRSAEDLDRLRDALGAERFVLVGYSYGTHLGLTYTRMFPERVARMVLHGVEGPDHTLKLPSRTQHALEVVDSLVREHPILSTRLDAFLDSLAARVAALEAKPESVQVQDTTIVFGAFEFRLLAARALGDRADVEQLPGAMVAILERGWDLLGPALLEVKRSPMRSGMSYAMDCASGATAAREARIAAEAPGTILGDAINFPFPEICAAWGVADLGDTFRGPVMSAVPTLFVSGDLDGRTPASNAAEVLAGFANGRSLLVENAGHNELASDRVVIDAIRAFMRGDATVPDRVRLPPLRFVIP